MTDREERDHFRLVLIETNTLLKAHIENFREYRESVSDRIDKHEELDNGHFLRIYSAIGKLKWHVAMGVGGFVAFQLAIKYFRG